MRNKYYLFTFLVTFLLSSLGVTRGTGSGGSSGPQYIAASETEIWNFLSKGIEPLSQLIALQLENPTLLALVQATTVLVKESPCYFNGEPKAAVAYVENDQSFICFSPPLLNDSALNRHDFVSRLTAVGIHEYAHLAGADEDEAKEVESQVLTWLPPLSYDWVMSTLPQLNKDLKLAISTLEGYVRLALFVGQNESEGFLVCHSESLIKGQLREIEHLISLYPSELPPFPQQEMSRLAAAKLKILNLISACRDSKGRIIYSVLNDSMSRAFKNTDGVMNLDEFSSKYCERGDVKCKTPLRNVFIRQIKNIKDSTVVHELRETHSLIKQVQQCLSKN